MFNLLRMDLRRLFRTRSFYIMLGVTAAFLMMTVAIVSVAMDQAKLDALESTGLVVTGGDSEDMMELLHGMNQLDFLHECLGSGFLLNNPFVLAVVYASTALPFTIYLLSGYFATLPHDFEEAAYIDGAGYGTTMVRIIFPMAQPSIITIILFNFLSFWNEYIISMTLMSSATGQKTLPVGLLNLMQAQQSAAQFGVLYAGLVLVMLPTLILYICVQKKLTQGMTVGGLKG